MVMQVEVRHEESFYSVNDENVQVVLLEHRDTSIRYMARDTSNTCRDVSLDNTRQTVNTQTSIMDLTKDEEEDDEDDIDDGNNSVLFYDLQTYEQEEEEVSSHESTLLSKFSLNAVTDTFVDSLCPAISPATFPTCALSSGSCTPQNPCSSSTSSSESCIPNQRLEIGMDVWNLLGCATDPGIVELESIWRVQPDVLKKRAPVRANIQTRLQRIHRLRMERWSGATRHGVTIAPTIHTIDRAYTMDDRMYNSRHRKSKSTDPLASLIGLGMDPILPHGDDAGYDSDPEFDVTPAPLHSLIIIPEDDERKEEEPESYDEQDQIIQQKVQQTLNSTWTLTWHPNPDNCKEFGISSNPICINVWIERGTVIANNGVVIEPTFMWRDAYQADLNSKRKLNASTQKPWSMRLLNTCRVAECKQLDRDLYPMARQANCLVMRTCHDQEFLLEASSPSQVQLVCERLKLVVARFASLAVTEDINAIAKEFFHPTLASQTLTLADL